jgi:hypothetical protein
MSGFNSVNDYVTITDGTASIGGASSESSFIIRAFGAAPGGSLPALTWGLYNGGKNRGTYNAANFVNSGMALAAGKTYAFTIALHPVQLTYDVTISDGISSVTKTNLGFRDNAFALPNTLVFNARVGTATNTLAVAVDTIAVAPRPVQSPLLSEAIRGADGFKFAFPAEPGEIYAVEQTSNLTPPVGWQTITSLVGLNDTMRYTDATASNLPARFFRVRVEP